MHSSFFKVSIFIYSKSWYRLWLDLVLLILIT
jgi:hypothetical protein